MNQLHKKEDIVLAGVELLSARGYHNTGVNQVLDVCGISKGTFYNYFQTKEDFAVDVIRVYGAELRRRLTEVLVDTTQVTPLQRIRAFYEGAIQMHVEEGCLQGCLVYNLSFETAGLSDRLATELLEQIQGLTDVLSHCIREGQNIGEIRTDLATDHLARLILTAANGAIAELKTSRSPATSRQVLDVVIKLLGTKSL